MATHAQTLAAVAGVVAKSGYFSMPYNSIGVPTSQAEFMTMIASRWDAEFSDYNGVSGYVAPTTQDLQAIYDRSTDSKGDPSTVNTLVYSVLIRDLIFLTPTDHKWQPYINVWAEYAKGGYSNDVTGFQNILAASRGEKVANSLYDQYVSTGLIGKSVFDSLPSGGRITGPIGNEPPANHVVDKLTELYIAYFARAPEHSGLDYWSQQYKTLVGGGLSEKDAYSSIANSFWPAASVSYSNLTGYSEGMSTRDFVTKVYSNVLGRPDAVQNDLAGIQYWVNALDSKAIKSKGDFIVELIDGAYSYIQSKPSDPVSIHVKDLLSHRIEVGRFFAQSQFSGNLKGEAAVKAGTAVLAGVDTSKASVDSVKQHIISGDIGGIEIALVGISTTNDTHFL